MLRKFRKKPVVIEAILFDGKNINEVLTWVGNSAERELIGHQKFGNVHSGNLIIHTLEGNHTANIGDWIIKGIKGEFYPCKPDIFEQTYEEVTN